MSRRYITTAIDYPNAAPHMGHVLEKVLADVIARYWRLKGEDVRFQIGTDEHGIKIQQTAKKQNLTPEQLVDKNVPLFEDLYGKLNISADIFIRTSDHAVSWPNVDAIKHRPTVEALWRKLQEAGVLEKRTYTGLYCSGCERFVTAKDLIDGKCPDHNSAPEKVEEENWFFLLSNEGDYLKQLLSKEYRIVPEYRAEETMALLERGLEDVSFSRPKSSLAWGIPVPGDEHQTMYVWCDALTNYISGLGLLTTDAQQEYWNDAQVTHVIGKDIARFHALIWPAMLKAAGVRAPDQLLIHGFVTNEGQKMSKSLGNVVEPNDVLARFKGNPDPMRFFLCHEIPVGRDGDFSWKRLEELYDAMLRNKLGNLLNRVLVLLGKNEGKLLPKEEIGTSAETILQKTMLESFWSDVYATMWGHYEDFMDAYDHRSTLLLLVQRIEDANKVMDEQKPWAIKDAYLKQFTLTLLAEMIRHLSLALLPFVPDTAYRIGTQLNVPYAKEMLSKDFVITKELKTWGGAKGWTKVGEPSILFAPLE